MDAPRVSSPRMQPNHGFTRGVVVVFDGSNWKRAAVGDVGFGIVGSISDQNIFEFVESGALDGLDGMTPGTLYYIDPDDSSLTPEVNGTPVFKAYTATEGHLLTGSGGGAVGSPVTQADIDSAVSTALAAVGAIAAPGSHTHDDRYARVDELAVRDEETGELVFDDSSPFAQVIRDA
jgi:hypothetical protein